MSGFLANILKENPAIAAHLGAGKAESAKRPVRMATCFRVLHLSRPAEVPRGETLVFTKEDSAALLKALILPPAEGAPTLDDTASCDAKVVLKPHPAKVVVELGLSVSSDSFDSCFNRLILNGFTTAKGFRLLATEAASPNLLCALANLGRGGVRSLCAPRSAKGEHLAGYGRLCRLYWCANTHQTGASDPWVSLGPDPLESRPAGSRLCPGPLQGIS